MGFFKYELYTTLYGITICNMYGVFNYEIYTTLYGLGITISYMYGLLKYVCIIYPLYAIRYNNMHFVWAFELNKNYIPLSNTHVPYYTHVPFSGQN